ncbi:MAG: tetratricopeptide repeat protein [Chloroflexota bacterium]
MTNKRPFLTLVILAAANVLWAQTLPWTPKLTMTRETWLPGEPISATLTLTNASGSPQPFEWHGQFFLDGASTPCVDRLLPVPGNPIPDAGGIGSRTATPPLLEAPGSVHTIEFAVTRCCNLLARAPETIGRHRLCYREPSENGIEKEACIEFFIVSPKDSDAAALNTFPPTLRDVVCDSASLKADLLESFPTSTYAGYVLAKKIPDYSNPLFHPVPPEEQVRRSREEGQTVVSFPEEDFEAYFTQLDRFMKGGNVPENLRPVLCGFYGDLLVQRGRFAEAAEAFRHAVQQEPQDAKGRAYYQRSQAFLRALEEKKSGGATNQKAGA